MKILFLTNNIISDPLIEWLVNDQHESVYVLDQKVTLQTVERYLPDFLISYSYRYIIKPDVISYFGDRAINLHISLLPWNKGADPNLWSFIENTPKGVSIHVVDRGVDTGNILIQKEIWFDEDKETLRSSYMSLHKEIQGLMKQNWENIKLGKILPKPQIQINGSIHFKKEFERIKFILGTEGWDVKIPVLKKRYAEMVEGN